jgi:mono/diheme cytochrome c family protein
LQHKTYLSAYLQDQVEKRHLDKNDGHRGRIWRIVADGKKPVAAPKLSKATPAELVKALSSPNGWVRDTAQRLIVERRDAASVGALEDVIVDAKAPPLAKVHALWARYGLDELDDDLIASAIADPDPRVRVTAMRVGEVLVRKKIGVSITKAIVARANDADASVQLQVLAMTSPDLPELVSAANKILAAHVGDPIFRAAAINGAAGRELETLGSILADKSFATSTKGVTDLLNDLAECVVRSRSADRIEKLFDLIASQPPAAAAGLLSGITDAVARPAKGKAPTRKLRLLREPSGLTKLASSSDKKLAGLANKVEPSFTWPNKPGDNTPPLKPLTADEQKLFDAGRETFATVCAQCHQPSGLGQDGVAPPLVDSEWVLGPPQRLARIALNGVHGPIKIGKKTVDMEMPGLFTMTDEQLAGVLTYVRREWGHEGSPVHPDLVAGARKDSASRGQNQWTAEELLQIK